MPSHLLSLLIYAAALAALGLWLGRRVATASDFFVAGRRLGPSLLFATLVAANIGAGSTVGAAGLGYRDGLSAWWWVGSAAVGSVVLAFTVGPRIWRVAEAHGHETVGDFLEWRYGPGVRAFLALLLWLGTLAILAGQLVALAWVLEVVAGVPKWAGCLVGGAVATAYFTAGGLFTSAWVNAFQLVIMLGGFALAVPLALSRAGGWTALAAATSGQEGYWSPWQGGASGVAYLALLAPAFVVSPGLLQKVYGARDARTVRVGVFANAVVLAVFAFVPPLLGMAARALHPALPHHELALPTLLLQDLPPWLGLLGLLAVVSAEVSTADAILFMLATSLSRDLYRRFLRPAATDGQVLKVARYAAVGGGAAGVLLAILAPTVISALSVFYTLLSVSLFVPVAAGIYFPRVDAVSVWAAIVAGIGTLAAAHLGGYGGTPVPSPALLGLLASALACFAATLRPGVRRPEPSA